MRDDTIQTARTRESHTSILCSPTDERHGEQEPATKGAIITRRADRREYGGHDSEADSVGNEDDARDGFSTTHPREDTLARCGIGKTGRAWTDGRIVASGSSEALEQRLGITERTDTLWNKMNVKDHVGCDQALHCRRCSRLCPRQ